MFSFNSRRKFQFDVPPSDRQLWAIGMVIAKWNAVEQMVKAFVHSFTSESDQNDPVRQRFDAERRMQRRLDIWEELTRERIQPSWQSAVLHLITETRQVMEMRDKIVHGAWSDKENATAISSEAHGPFSWGAPGHPFSWKLTFQGIMDVALRIDRLQSAMFDLAFTASGKRESGGNFTIGSAMRRIQQQSGLEHET